jgi:putative radical SAM enzyme (TIGR03279 family)
VLHGLLGWQVMPATARHPLDAPYVASIREVVADSPAARAGVAPGWSLLRVNGAWIPDVLAYRRELAAGDAVLEVAAAGSEEVVRFAVSWEDPGLEFDDVIFDGLRLCANKCDFCYVHQMPQGFRKSLYVMDDDYRTSFLYGSFVTLTNLSEEDVRRILDEHLSPLYVSVHTADEELRRDMMKWWRSKVKDPAVTRIRDMIERLEAIDLYTQVVALPGRNDGDALDATLAYLASRPNVRAVAVVPVGLTHHRVNLPTLEPYTPAQAAETLDRVEAFAARMLEERGTRFAFLSDEFYLVAGRPLPTAAAYEGFEMLENGVGMVRDFLASGIGEAPLPQRLGAPRRVVCATGALFAPVLEEALAPLAVVAGLDLEVRAITNRTFGSVTTVAGLLAGRDLSTQIAPGEADLLLVSPSMLKYGTETFLDERTLGDLRRELRMDVRVGGRDLRELVATILARPGDGARPVPQFGFSTHAVKEAARQG